MSWTGQRSLYPPVQLYTNVHLYLGYRMRVSRSDLVYLGLWYRATSGYYERAATY